MLLERVSWGVKTYQTHPERGQHHPMGRSSRLTEKGIERSVCNIHLSLLPGTQRGASSLPPPLPSMMHCILKPWAFLPQIASFLRQSLAQAGFKLCSNQRWPWTSVPPASISQEQGWESNSEPLACWATTPILKLLHVRYLDAAMRKVVNKTSLNRHFQQLPPCIRYHQGLRLGLLDHSDSGCRDHDSRTQEHTVGSSHF